MKRSRRGFTNEFKRQVVEEYVGGVASQAQLCRRYELSPTLLREWRRKYDAGAFGEEDVRRFLIALPSLVERENVTGAVNER